MANEKKTDGGFSNITSAHSPDRKNSYVTEQILRRQGPFRTTPPEDINIHLEAEEELRMICLAVEQSTEGIAVTDAEDNFKFVNTAFAGMHGYERKELYGKNYSVVLAKVETEMPGEKDKMLTRNYPLKGEILHVRKDGSRFSAMIHTGDVSGKDGKQIGVVRTIRDVTVAKEREMQLLENQRRYYSLFEECPVALITQDASAVKEYIQYLRDSGVEDIREYLNEHPDEVKRCVSLLKIIDVNMATLEMFKAKSNREYCDNIAMTFTEDSYKSFVNVAAEFYNGSFCFEAEEIRKDLYGNEIHALVRVSISPGCERDWSKILVSIVDITRRKLIEYEMIADRQRLRDLASQLSRVEEQQRRRIATDLHDHICQSLALSVIRLEGLRDSCKGRCEGVAEGAIDKICETMLNTITRTRELIFDLSSPTLYRFGLEPAVTELMTEQFRDYKHIRHKFITDKKPKPLAEDVSVLLFKAIREALVNIIKYADASNVIVDIRRSDDNISISIKDDGIGFDADGVGLVLGRSGGFGLFNIRERLDYVGGRFAVDSQVGLGTTVTLQAPLEV